MPRRPLTVLAVAVAFLGVAACGDDDDGANGTQATTVSRAEAQSYQRQVQSVLVAVGAAGTGLQTSVERGASLGRVATALDRFQASVERAARRLDGLDPPAGAQEAQDEMVTVLRDLAGDVQPSIDAAREGDREEFVRIFRAYQRKLDGEYRQRLRAAGERIDRALARR